MLDRQSGGKTIKFRRYLPPPTEVLELTPGQRAQAQLDIERRAAQRDAIEKAGLKEAPFYTLQHAVEILANTPSWAQIKPLPGATLASPMRRRWWGLCARARRMRERLGEIVAGREFDE